MKHLVYISFVIIFLNSCQEAELPQATDEWELVWSDEFETGTLDETKWTYEYGDGSQYGLPGWGNNEAQYYREENVIINNGTLSLIGKKEDFGGKEFTSGRIKSLNKGDFKYGKIEASIRLTDAGGSWPAFWMIPTEHVYGSWPRSGEIDIMEQIGNDPNEIFGTAHFGNSNNDKNHIGKGVLSTTVTSEFHTYSIEWEENKISWFFDGDMYHQLTPDDVGDYIWPFNEKFYIILNLAIGGNLGGAVSDIDYPASIEIDYVRVYTKKDTED